jgi:hypothetical protein
VHKLNNKASIIVLKHVTANGVDPLTLFYAVKGERQTRQFTFQNSFLSDCISYNKFFQILLLSRLFAHCSFISANSSVVPGTLIDLLLKLNIYYSDGRPERRLSLLVAIRKLSFGLYSYRRSDIFLCKFLQFSHSLTAKITAQKTMGTN